MFERVHHIVYPACYFDRVIRLRFRRLDLVVPDISEMLNKISMDPSAWQLVGAETRKDIGKFVRSHWNLHWRNRWYRVVFDQRGNVYNIKPIPDEDEGFGKAVTRGPDYEFTERVNQALMDTTRGRRGCGSEGLMN